MGTSKLLLHSRHPGQLDYFSLPQGKEVMPHGDVNPPQCLYTNARNFKPCPAKYLGIRLFPPIPRYVEGNQPYGIELVVVVS